MGKQKCMTAKHAQQMEAFILKRFKERIHQFETHSVPGGAALDISLCAKDKIKASIEIEIEVPSARSFNPDKDLVFVKNGDDFNGYQKWWCYTND